MGKLDIPNIKLIFGEDPFKYRSTTPPADVRVHQTGQLFISNLHGHVCVYHSYPHGSSPAKMKKQVLYPSAEYQPVGKLLFSVKARVPGRHEIHVYSDYTLIDTIRFKVVEKLEPGWSLFARRHFHGGFRVTLMCTDSNQDVVPLQQDEEVAIEPHQSNDTNTEIRCVTSVKTGYALYDIVLSAPTAQFSLRVRCGGRCYIVKGNKSQAAGLFQVSAISKLFSKDFKNIEFGVFCQREHQQKQANKCARTNAGTYKSKALIYGMEIIVQSPLNKIYVSKISFGIQAKFIVREQQYILHTEDCQEDHTIITIGQDLPPMNTESGDESSRWQEYLSKNNRKGNRYRRYYAAITSNIITSFGEHAQVIRNLLWLVNIIKPQKIWPLHAQSYNHILDWASSYPYMVLKLFKAVIYNRFVQALHRSR